MDSVKSFSLIYQINSKINWTGVDRVKAWFMVHSNILKTQNSDLEVGAGLGLGTGLTKVTFSMTPSICSAQKN